MSDIAMGARRRSKNSRTSNTLKADFTLFSKRFLQLRRHGDTIPEDVLSQMGMFIVHRLIKGRPALASKAMLDDGSPEDEDIDAAAVAARTPRGALAALVPRAEPKAYGPLQFSNDLVGDVCACAVTKAQPRGCSCVNRPQPSPSG